MTHPHATAHSGRVCPRNGRMLRLCCWGMLLGSIWTFPGCSIQSLVVKKAAAALSGTGTVFSGDDDPELIQDALPFALKTYESLLQAAPDDDNLLLATGSAFTMYAYAFVQLAADTLPDERIGERKFRQARAKKLYLRARRYLFRALDIRHPGLVEALGQGNPDSVLARTQTADTALLYWTGMSWMGAFTADKFDMELAVGVPQAVALIRRTMDLDDDYGRGAAHEFFISYFGSMPPSMGGSHDKARAHYARVLEIAGDTKAAPHVALATSVAVANQDADEFRSLLHKALSVSPDASEGDRLVNILSHRRARWLLDHIDQFFLIDDITEQEDLQ